MLYRTNNLLLASTLCLLGSCAGGRGALAQTLPLPNASSPAASVTAPDWDLRSDTWAATDALNRTLPMGGRVRAPQPEKLVGMFYFIWQGEHGTPGPYDISKLLAADPKNPKWGGEGAFHWWGEPEAGYFRALDPWVIRRNLALIQAAGVDVLFLDVTNSYTYPQEVKALCDMAMAMRAQGQHTPQIAFITHANAAQTQQKLWDEFYSKDLYPELWFKWQGKPLILGIRDDKLPDGQELPDQIKDFFTWRYSWAWDAGPGKWQWIDKYPQNPGLSPEGVVEQMPVAVASHPTSNIGRSFHGGQEPPLDEHLLAPTYGEGLHFQEQWERALQVDPPFIFVDGWNEWVAQRFVVHDASGPDFLGKPTKTGDSFFVDAFNAEFNRDIEPMKSGSSDNLYYQLVANVRRFKGARPVPVASAPRRLNIGGGFGQWNTVAPEYRSAIGDTLHRDAPGWGDLHYENTSGRNDIVAAKVARDNRRVYFYVRAHAPLSPRSDPKWMMLFIDADQNPRTGWHGYDLRVNARGGDNRHASVERWQNGAWRSVAPAPMAFSGAQLELSLPRSLWKTPDLAFDFKWVDNAAPDDLSDWFTNGDVAPPRRFNFRFVTTTGAAAAAPRQN